MKKTTFQVAALRQKVVVSKRTNEPFGFFVSDGSREAPPPESGSSRVSRRHLKTWRKMAIVGLVGAVWAIVLFPDGLACWAVSGGSFFVRLVFCSRRKR